MQVGKQVDLAVIGGGAAGFMGAIKAAEDGVSAVFVFEATSKTLEKVRISGGGRCNVTHACWEPKELVPNYPRGEIPLLGAFSLFATGDALAWFEERGLELVSEEDGRIFPKSNSSRDVIQCLRNSANRAGVICSTKMEIIEIEFLIGKGYRLKCRDGTLIYSKKVLLATGGNPVGKKLANMIGHKTISSVPSLFSFKLDPHYLQACAGISIDNVKLKLLCGNKKFTDKNRVLITHKGLSGPGILRLSAFAARDLYNERYKASLEINWVNKTSESIANLCEQYRRHFSSTLLINNNPFSFIPKRLWLSFLNEAEIMPNTRWSGLSKVCEKYLIEILCRKNYLINGKGPFGEEFVTAGGVNLDEINIKTMESRVCEGLYFAGEVLDIDGVTGGFNFQHCWTSGWIAGGAIAKSLLT